MTCGTRLTDELQSRKRPYPRNFAGNVRHRAYMQQISETDLEYRAYVIEACRRDVLAFMDLFCVTKDPRRVPDVLPWISYDFQLGAVRDIEAAIDTGEDLLIDKSRDMGASWMVLYVLLHKWLFESGSDIRIGSRKEEFVDKPKIIDTLFEKLRFTLEHLPYWLMPEGFDWKKHSTFMKLYNPKLGNTIVGESANPSFGSGGRSKAILLDEFAKWDDSIAIAAWTSTADVTKCRLAVSTPVGSGNKFAQLALGTGEETIKRISLHWTLHPHKAKDAYYLDGAGTWIPVQSPEQAFKLWNQGVKVRSPWYDAEANRRSIADLAQEVDIDYLQSGSPFFDIPALKLQKVWKHRKSKIQGEPIPWGYHIKTVILDVNGQITMREDDQNGWLRVYERPDKHCQYAIGADTAEGLAKGDECFLVVRDKYTRNVVAVFNGLIDPGEFGYRLWLVHRYYNNAVTAPENNNHGYTTCYEFDKYGGHLYFTRPETQGATQSIAAKRGWTTTAKTRPYMLNQLGTEIRTRFFEIRDDVLIKQCLTFVRNEKHSGKPEADGILKDDGVIALAISSAVILEQPYKATKATRRVQRATVEDVRNKHRNAGIGY